MRWDGVDWFDLPHNGGQRRALENTVMTFSFNKMLRNFWIAVHLAAPQEWLISVEFSYLVYYLSPLFNSDVFPKKKILWVWGGGADVSVNSLLVGNFIATVPTELSRSSSRCSYFLCVGTSVTVRPKHLDLYPNGNLRSDTSRVVSCVRPDRPVSEGRYLVEYIPGTTPHSST